VLRNARDLPSHLRHGTFVAGGDQLEQNTGLGLIFGDAGLARSLLITANQPFGEWGKIFSDQAMTLADDLLAALATAVCKTSAVCWPMRLLNCAVIAF
jgi:hypothetical protein